MTTSSARPDRLEAFSTDVAPIATALSTLRTQGIDLLDAFVAGAGEVDVSLDPTAHLEYLLDLRREVDHLGGWVAGVGAGFRQAGGDTDGDGVFDVDDTALSKLVGEPSILEAEAAARGQDAARELQAKLEELGIDPESFDPQDLVFLDPGSDDYREVFELIEAIGDEMWSEDYAVGFFDSMDEEGIRATLGLIDSFAATKGNTGLVGPDTDWMGDIDERLLVPLANGWANASGSVDLEEEREGFLNPDGDRWWEQRHLALLMAGTGRNYDPTWLADAADVILVERAEDNYGVYPDSMSSGSGADTTSSDWYPALAQYRDLYADTTLRYPGLIALRAIQDNTEAANDFALRGTDQLDVLVHPEENIWVSPVTSDVEDIVAQMNGYGARAIERAFLEAPYEQTGEPGQEQPMVGDWDVQLDGYHNLMDLVGDGDVADVIKQSAARTLLPYLPDISLVAAEGYLQSGDQDGRFARPTLVDFFEELGYDPEATRIAGDQIGAWGTAGLAAIDVDDLDNSDAIQTHLRRINLITDVAADGLLANADSREQAAKDLWGGIARGSAFVLAAGAAAVPLIVGGPVGAPLSAAIATGSGIVNFGLGTAAADPPSDVPEVDADDIERELTTAWRESLIDRLVDEGVINGNLSIEDQANELTRLMGGEDEFMEIQQSVGQRNYGADDHW